MEDREVSFYQTCFLVYPFLTSSFNQQKRRENISKGKTEPSSCAFVLVLTVYFYVLFTCGVFRFKSTFYYHILQHKYFSTTKKKKNKQACDFSCFYWYFLTAYATFIVNQTWCKSSWSAVLHNDFDILFSSANDTCIILNITHLLEKYNSILLKMFFSYE